GENDNERDAMDARLDPPRVTKVVEEQQAGYRVEGWGRDGKKTGGSDFDPPDTIWLALAGALQRYYGVGLPAIAAPSGQRLYQLIMYNWVRTQFDGFDDVP